MQIILNVLIAVIIILFIQWLIKEYPAILAPDNTSIIGITQEPSTQACYLVFYDEIVDQIIQRYEHIQYIPYGDLYELEEIGVGGYGTIYTAKYNGKLKKHISMSETVVLKRFKSFDEMPE